MTPRLYSHHGLVVRSDIALAAAATPAAEVREADVRIDLWPDDSSDLDLDWRRLDTGSVWRASDASGSWLKLRYEREDAWAEFVVDPAGRRVLVRVSAGVALADAGELVLGPVFSCLMSHRGSTCLHASVVVTGDGAVAFAGPKGAGKSTTAMALVQRGARLVSDDVAVLAERDGRCVVAGGRRSARIRPDYAATLAPRLGAGRPIWAADYAAGDKRVIEPADRSSAAADPDCRLTALVLLDPRGAPDTPADLRRAAPAVALPLIMASRHMAAILDRSAHGRDLALLARLLRDTPAYRMDRPDGLGNLDAAIDVVTRTIPALASLTAAR